MNLIKKYSPLSADFSDLPMAVRDILVHSFDKLDKLHFEKLRELGSLDHPNGNILDYELLAENQSEMVNNDNALYPSDQISVPKLKSDENNETNNSIPNLGGSLSSEPEPTKEVSTEVILEPTDIGDPDPGSIKPKKSKPKVPPTSIKTRSAAKLKETIESDSDSDTDIKKVSFGTNL